MIVILAHQRSGTHLLASLLNSHPHLKIYDEIFLPSKYRLTLGRKNFSDLVENEGCIVMYSQFLRVPGEIREAISNKAKVIHLMRRNLNNQARSLALIAKSKITTRAKPHRTDLNTIKESILLARSLVFNRPFSRLFEIYYEDICADNNISRYENPDLLTFLEVKPITLTTNLTKTSHL